MSVKRTKSKIYEPYWYTTRFGKSYKKASQWFIKKLERDSKDILKHKDGSIKKKVDYDDGNETDNGLW